MNDTNVVTRLATITVFVDDTQFKGLITIGIVEPPIDGCSKHHPLEHRMMCLDSLGQQYFEINVDMPANIRLLVYAAAESNSARYLGSCAYCTFDSIDPHSIFHYTEPLEVPRLYFTLHRI